MIGRINLDMKCVGARSAGNPHAACDEEGAGDGVTDDPTRARREKSRTQTRERPSDHRASPRPYRTTDSGRTCPVVQDASEERAASEGQTRAHHGARDQGSDDQVAAARVPGSDIPA